MEHIQWTVTVGDRALAVSLKPDARLRKTARWSLRNGTLHVRVPRGMSREHVETMLASIERQIARREKRARRRTDAELMARAEAINQRYFAGELSWRSIRWAGNMKHRLGSCTNGGATDGDIRISDRIRHWPAYVVDYIIAHEICHRKHSDHSPDFWAYLSRYPFAEKARGFIEGIGYAEGVDPDTLID